MDHVFGRPSVRRGQSEWDAKACLQGAGTHTATHSAHASLSVVALVKEAALIAKSRVLSLCRTVGGGCVGSSSGGYSPEECEPDTDLGKAITPGFRNLTTETRAYGSVHGSTWPAARQGEPLTLVCLLAPHGRVARRSVPSIRTDIPKYARRSIADSQNYGDDVNASYLLHPSQFAGQGVEDEEFVKPRDKVTSQSPDNTHHTLP